MKSLRAWGKDLRTYPLWLRVSLIASSLIFAIGLIVQTVLFTDNPIYLKAGEYVGKYGAKHTQAEFETFTMINRTILISGIFTFAGLVFAVVLKPAPESSQTRESAIDDL